MGHVLDAIGDVLYVHTVLQLAASPDGFFGHSSWRIGLVFPSSLLHCWWWTSGQLLLLSSCFSVFVWLICWPKYASLYTLYGLKVTGILELFFHEIQISPKIKLANWNSVHCCRQIHLGLFSRQKFNPHTQFKFFQICHHLSKF